MKPGNRRKSTVLILAETFRMFLGDERERMCLFIYHFLIAKGSFLYPIVHPCL